MNRMCVLQTSARGWNSRQSTLKAAARLCARIKEPKRSLPVSPIPQMARQPCQKTSHAQAKADGTFHCWLRQFLPFKLKGHAVFPGDMEIPGFWWHFCLSFASLLQALPFIYLPSGRQPSPPPSASFLSHSQSQRPQNQ